MTREAFIVLEHVTKRFKRTDFTSVDALTFTILKGEKFGVFGPNGAGKTTLISMICGLLQPDTGTVRYVIDGEELSTRDVRQKIGYVPQEYAFFEELSPQQNLEYFGALYGIPTRELKTRIADLLGILGLTAVARKKIRTFSGGMKRRVNLAVGMIHQPLVLFLDEPTVGVDVQSKRAIMRYLEELNARGTTIIYTSHHLREAEEFCDRLLLMDHGKMIALNDLDRLLKEHDAGCLEDFFMKLTGSEYRD